MTTKNKKRAKGSTDGEREELGERWDFIPYRGLRWVVKVLTMGGKKYAPWNWEALDFDSDQSPLSHAISHAIRAEQYPLGSVERLWQLAKATCNLLFQLWWEDQILEKSLNPDGARAGCLPPPR